MISQVFAVSYDKTTECTTFDDTPPTYGGYRSGVERKQEGQMFRYLGLFIACSLTVLICLPILIFSVLAVPVIFIAVLIV